MNKSPERHTFHRQCAIDRAVEDGRDPETDESVQQELEMELMFKEHTMEREASTEWQQNNLEYDLRNTKWICNKAKAREEYAQNLYAAMCNNDFQKLEVWPLLKGETYSCSWRYAGGIVADMIEQGDYIDWYCSGIRGGASEEELAAMTEEQRTKYKWYDEKFVSESVVTDEVREDLKKLGWNVIEENNDNI
jgi:hypothetical protein